MSTGSRLSARLIYAAMAFSILLVAISAVPSNADAGCRLAGVSISVGDTGEAVVLDINGTPEYQVVPLENSTGIAVVLADCELVDGFQLPSIGSDSVISQIEYRLTLLAGTQSIELTIKMEPGTYQGYVVDTSEPGLMKVSLTPEITSAPPAPLDTPPVIETEVVEEVEVMWYGPREGDPDAIYRVDTIDVITGDASEEIVISLDKPATPRVRKFSYPDRIVFELDGGYLAEDVDEYLYTSRDGLIEKVDILFSPQHLAGVFQLIISCPGLETYETLIDGNTYTIIMYSEGAAPVELVEPEIAPLPIEPVAEEVEILEPEPVPVVEEAPVIEPVVELVAEPVIEPVVPEVTVIPEPEEMVSEPAEPVMEEIVEEPVIDRNPTSFYEYPDVPFEDDEDAYGAYAFPEAEESFDPDHVSDAIVSLNVTAADFVSVMMILAEQAGVNFVLDAYWNMSPTGFVREGFRPPGGPAGSGSGGSFGGGGGFNPALSGGGAVTMHLSEVPFDYAFKFLLQAHNLRYKVFRDNPDSDPILFISSRERIEAELGLGNIQIYHLHYIDPGSAIYFLRTMDLLPSTSGYGYWEYGGGGNNNNSGGGGGGGGDSGGGSGSSGLLASAKAGAIGIMATSETHDQIRNALMQIDKPPKQIIVEATFITYDESDPNRRPMTFGLQNIGDWALEGGSDRFWAGFDTTGAEGIVFEILPKNQSVPFDDFRARFHYIFTERNAKIISSPRVAVIDGFTATIDVTENRPFIVDGGVVIDQFGNPIPAPDIVTFVPTGTTLTVTPFIDDYGNVTMNMSPTNTTLLSEPELINGNLVFGTANASITTTLRMRDGETIILGGLKVKNRDYQTMRIPLLGDLPLIGALFGETKVTVIESQLIILMTVHMVGS